MAKEIIKGGEFLIRESKAEDVFIPEEFDEEQTDDRTVLYRISSTRSYSKHRSNRQYGRRIDAFFIEKSR